MIIFLNMDGSAKKVTPERIYRGSGGVTEIDVIAPFPSTACVKVAFVLPSEEPTPYRPMQYRTESAEAGELVGVWAYTLPQSVTEYAGEVKVCFNVTYRDSSKQNRTSYECRFTVEESVLPELSAGQPTVDLYDLYQQYYQEAAASATRAEQTANDARDEVSKLKQPPDCTEAGNVGTPEVIITADGKFKFRNLKGERGEPGQDGVNGTVQWGIDGPCPISTLQWKEI